MIPTENLPKPTFESFADASRFFVDVKNDNGEDGKMMIRLNKACVVISIPCRNGSIEKVAFMKTNRSKSYRDSRGRKVTKKDESGDKVEVIRPLMISEDEVQSELVRLLGCSATAYEAFRALQA